MVLTLAHATIQSTYGSIMLIIDRYKRKDRTMYKLLEGGNRDGGYQGAIAKRENVVPKKEALLTYLMLNHIYTVMDGKVKKYNEGKHRVNNVDVIGAPTYKFRLQLL